ncbi:hypothetical protein BC829DRAFT_445170 [Chytridium lagenaria]|nr:hypothetical protein BC829DRAFT_445170 [Chytridium lagenaria]
MSGSDVDDAQLEVEGGMRALSSKILRMEMEHLWIRISGSGSYKDVPENVLLQRKKEVEKLDAQLSKIKTTKAVTASGHAIRMRFKTFSDDAKSLLEELFKSLDIETVPHVIDMLDAVTNGKSVKRKSREETVTGTPKKAKVEKDNNAKSVVQPAKLKSINKVAPAPDLIDDEVGSDDADMEDLDDEFAVDPDFVLDNSDDDFDDIDDDAEEDDDEEDTVSKRAPKPSKTSKPSKPSKPSKTTGKLQSTFVTSLGDGLSDVSISDAEEDEIRDEMAKLWEKEYGKEAKHLQVQAKLEAPHIQSPPVRYNDRSTSRGSSDRSLRPQEKLHPSWEAKKANNAGIKLPSGQKRRFGDDDVPTAAAPRPAPSFNANRTPIAKKNTPAGKLHPSWEAKKMAAKSQIVAAPAGKKMKFDDD